MPCMQSTINKFCHDMISSLSNTPARFKTWMDAGLLTSYQYSYCIIRKADCEACRQLDLRRSHSGIWFVAQLSFNACVEHHRLGGDQLQLPLLPHLGCQERHHTWYHHQVSLAHCLPACLPVCLSLCQCVCASICTSVCISYSQGPNMLHKLTLAHCT